MKAKILGEALEHLNWLLEACIWCHGTGKQKGGYALLPFSPCRYCLAAREFYEKHVALS